MPTCNSCGKNYEDANQIELVRNKDNRWVALCRSCRDQGVDVNLVEPGGIAVDETALSAATGPAITIEPSGNPVEDAKKLLDALRGLRQSGEHLGRGRSHERKHIELTVNYTLARDDKRQECVVKDYSQGGLRIVTSRFLPKGQIVQFDWNIPLPAVLAQMFQPTAEVRRSTRNDDGSFDIGLKFLSRQPDKGANRRRFRRFKCDMLVFYRRTGGELMSSGRVIDISQGGCQMRVDEPLNRDELVSVRIVGGGGARGDLVGTVRVCRTGKRDEQYDVGCAFEQMRMERQGMAHPTAEAGA